MLVKAHITFDGQAEEALNFYKKVFNGQIEDLLRYGDIGDNPMTASLDEKSKNMVMNARLTFGNTVIGVSDSLPHEPLVKGNNIAMDIAFFDGKEIHKLFNALSDNGKVIMPLTATFFSPNFGKLIDKFGITWDFMQMPGA